MRAQHEREQIARSLIAAQQAEQERNLARAAAAAQAFELKAQHAREDALSVALIARLMQMCPRCGVRIENNSGCNHIHCKRADYLEDGSIMLIMSRYSM